VNRGLAALPLLASLLWAGILAAEEPGQRFLYRPQDMPKPFATESAGNPPDIVARPSGQAPRPPAGYRANLFASGLDHARWLLAAPTGEVFLAEARHDKVTLLIDRDKDGVADEKHVFADGHNTPHGLALHGGYLYVADLDRVWRYRWQPGQTRAAGRPEAFTADGALGAASGHWTRNIAIDPKGEGLYVAIGSRGNIAEEPAPRAAIKRFDMKTREGAVYASGLRNPVGIAFHPDTGMLYTSVNERDGLGDELVPDYFTSVRQGGFYGWPYAYIGSHPQPRFAQRRPDLVAKAIVPDVILQSHSAPMQVLFAKGGDFPPDWQDDAFVAFRGSWNAAFPRGYKVVRIPFENGKPSGGYVNFITGFRLDAPGAEGPARVWGRPVGLALLPDGSMLIAVDAAQEIWRISRVK
jgi:glucose/arabinose dehydrogenase